MNNHLMSYLELSHINLHDKIKYLITTNNIQELRKVLRNKKIRELIDIEYNDGIFLRLACVQGVLGIVKLLLFDKKIGTCSQLKLFYPNNEFSPLSLACYKGHFKVIKFLLTHPDLENKIDINENNNIALRFAFSQNNLPLIKYLMTSKKLKVNSNIKNIILELFRVTFYNIEIKGSNYETLLFLIKQCNKNNIMIQEYENEENENLLSLAVKSNNVLIMSYIYPYFEKEKHLVLEALTLSLIEKCFVSASFLLIDKKYEIPNNIHLYTNMEVKQFIDKIKIYLKMNRENNEKQIIKKI